MFEWSWHRQEQRAGRLLSIYEGVRQACETPRRFEFEVTSELPEPPGYGGRAPSRIIDPSEFLAVSGELAAAVPADAFRSEAGRAAYQREPGRFDRLRRRETRSGYERIQAAYAAVSG